MARIQLRRGVQRARSGGVKKDSAALMTTHRTGGRRTRSLRTLVHSHGVATAPAPTASVTAAARRQGPAALRAAQQLAGQRQPGQGASPALATSRVRPEDFWADLIILTATGRPGNDGFQDLRVRRRSRGRLGAGSDVYWVPRRPGWVQALPPGDGISRIRLLPSDGPESTSTRKAQRQPGSGRGCQRYPRDLSLAWR